MLKGYVKLLLITQSIPCCVLTQLVDEDDEVLMALLNLEGTKPGKICASFEDLERQRREEEQKKAEEEAKRRLEEEKRLFAEARKSMVSLRVWFCDQNYDLHVFYCSGFDVIGC